jgi:spore maturation protein CgeB
VNVVIFGLSVSSAWGNGHATLWRGLLRAMAREGHRVTFFERDVPWYAQHRDLHRGDGYEIVLYPSWDEVVRAATKSLAFADVGIVTSFCPDAESASSLLVDSHARRVFYDLDTPVTLERLRRGERVEYLPSAGLSDFDLVLSYTGGPSLEALVSTLGARRAAPLYGSVDLATHGRGEHDASFACDLSYLGTYAVDRQEKVESLLLASAARLPLQKFLLGGPMYPEAMLRPRNLELRAHVPPPQHPAFYGSSRLTLNVTRAAMADVGWCPSGRLFEAAACGAPIISDAWRGLGEFFELGREILIAADTDDVIAALEVSDEALRAVARRARERVLAAHTAERRARELIALIER